MVFLSVSNFIQYFYSSDVGGRKVIIHSSRLLNNFNVHSIRWVFVSYVVILELLPQIQENLSSVTAAVTVGYLGFETFNTFSSHSNNSKIIWNESKHIIIHIFNV